MRHPESQRFYQSGPGGEERINFSQGSTVAGDTQPAWTNKDEWELLKRQGRAPLPTSAAPESMTDKEMSAASAAGHYQAMKPYMHRRMYRNAQESGMPMPDDIAHGHPLMTGRRRAGGGGAGMPVDTPFTGEKMMSVGGTPAKYSKADIKREAGLASRQRGQAAVFAQARDAFTKDMVQQSFGWIQAAQNEQKAAGVEAGAARDEYLKASRAIQTNRARLDKMQIDPDRYWKNLTESQKVLNVIGLIFGGLAEGFSQGRIKNAAAAAIQNAQERDMAAQSANMKKMLQTIDMDDRDRASMWSRWQAGEARRRAASLSVMQIQLSRAGLMEKRLGIKEQYAGIINGLDAHMNNVLRQSRGRGGRKVPTPEYQQHLDITKGKALIRARGDESVRVAQVRAAMAKGKGDRGDVGASNAISQIESMVKSYKGSAWATLFGQALTDDAADYQQKKGLLGLSLWRMFDSGKLSDADMKMAFTMFFPNAKRALWERTKGIDVRQMLRLRGWLRERMRGTGNYNNTGLTESKKTFAKMFNLSEDRLTVTPRTQDTRSTSASGKQ